MPESVFVEQARALGLGDVERERLREELAGLGLPALGAWCMQTVTVRMRKWLHGSVKKVGPGLFSPPVTGFGRC